MEVLNMTNFTDTGPQALLRTPPPTQSQDSSNALLEILIYLFALMCADNQTCTAVFRTLMAVIVTCGNALIACIPGVHLKDKYESKDVVDTANRTMFVAWLTSNVAGVYAFKSLYNHEMRYVRNVDNVDKFDIISQAAFGASVVSAVYSGVAAGFYMGLRKPMTNMYRNVKDKCCGLRDIGSGYSSLDSGDDFNNTRSNRCLC